MNEHQHLGPKQFTQNHLGVEHISSSTNDYIEFLTIVNRAKSYNLQLQSLPLLMTRGIPGHARQAIKHITLTIQQFELSHFDKDAR